MLDTICQIVIPVLTGLNIYMLARTDHWQRWGYVVGLLAQPFWFYATIMADQWGLFVLSCWVTYSLSMGVWRRFDMAVWT